MFYDFFFERIQAPKKPNRIKNVSPRISFLPVMNSGKYTTDQKYNPTSNSEVLPSFTKPKEQSKYKEEDGQSRYIMK
jgi:hypothetical protein